MALREMADSTSSPLLYLKSWWSSRTSQGSNSVLKLGRNRVRPTVRESRKYYFNTSKSLFSCGTKNTQWSWQCPRGTFENGELTIADKGISLFCDSRNRTMGLILDARAKILAMVEELVEQLSRPVVRRCERMWEYTRKYMTRWIYGVCVNGR